MAAKKKDVVQVRNPRTGHYVKGRGDRPKEHETGVIYYRPTDGDVHGAQIAWRPRRVGHRPARAILVPYVAARRLGRACTAPRDGYCLSMLQSNVVGIMTDGDAPSS